MILSPYILAIIAAICMSQAFKYLIVMVRRGDFDPVRQLYSSGNMPSTHAAASTALLVVVGLYDGVDSAAFGLALLFTIIIMYDSIILRRSVGDQGRAVQQLIKMSKSDIALPRAAKGHTPLELMVGAALGVAIGLVVFFATY